MVKPATKHKASSGTPGKKNRIGKRSLDFLSNKFWVLSSSSFPISFVTSFSPNLSPIKKRIVFDKSVATKQAINAVNVLNKIRDKAIKLSLSRGIKHNVDKSTDVIRIYVITAKEPKLSINFLILEMLVNPNAFKIKNRDIDNAAKNIITSKIFNHFFIMHCMLKVYRLL